MRVLAGFFAFVYSVTAMARNPNGETASYVLDKNRERTSSLIREGSAVATVAGEITEQDKKFYAVNIHYKLRILFAGKKEGDQPLKFPAIYFTDEFFKVLRVKKIFVTKQFKMEHHGRSDVKTMQGITYKDCDHILLTDIEIPPSPTFENLMTSLVKTAKKHLKLTSAAPKNIVIDTYISSEVPAIGAVKFDISGVANGAGFSAGFDVLKP